MFKLKVIHDILDKAGVYGSECEHPEAAARLKMLVGERDTLRVEVEWLQAEQKRIVTILKCPDVSEDIPVPSNLPNVIRDRMAEIGRLREKLAWCHCELDKAWPMVHRAGEPVPDWNREYEADAAEAAGEEE